MSDTSNTPPDNIFITLSAEGAGTFSAGTHFPNRHIDIAQYGDVLQLTFRDGRNVATLQLTVQALETMRAFHAPEPQPQVENPR